MALDAAVLALLNLDSTQATQATVAPSGKGSSSASTSKVTVNLADGTRRLFFLKTLTGEDGPLLVQGEHASLQAIHSAVPDLCPKSYGYGSFQGSPSTSFLLLEFVQLSSPSLSSALWQTFYRRDSLAEKLGRLHTTPAPTPKGYSRPQFGFAVTTCCGDTPQENSYKDSWAEFFAENRLRYILTRAEKKHGQDPELRRLVENTIAHVVPRLIGDAHLNNGERVTPVVVHGDLWSGNACLGTFPGKEPHEVIYDPSACYAHSEYEIGIMKIFGGFGAAFFTDYHRHVPKTAPALEYDDRISLYEVYHYLNHYAIFGNAFRFMFFGGRYRTTAVKIMSNLCSKYHTK